MKEFSTSSRSMQELPFQEPPYIFWAEIAKIYDGDTFYCWADLGFHVRRYLKIRMDSINTAEIRGSERPEGLEDLDYVKQFMAVGDKVVIQSKKDKSTKTGGFDRWAAHVWVDTGADGEEQWLHLNHHLIDVEIAEYTPH